MKYLFVLYLFCSTMFGQTTTATPQPLCIAGVGKGGTVSYVYVSTAAAATTQVRPPMISVPLDAGTNTFGKVVVKLDTEQFDKLRSMLLGIALLLAGIALILAASVVLALFHNHEWRIAVQEAQQEDELAADYVTSPHGEEERLP